MKAILEIEMPETCYHCPLTKVVTDSEGNPWPVCVYTKKCFQGEKKRLRGCPLKEIKTGEATYTDYELKIGVNVLTDMALKLRKEITYALGTINTVIKILPEQDKKDDEYSLPDINLEYEP